MADTAEPNTVVSVTDVKLDNGAPVKHPDESTASSSETKVQMKNPCSGEADGLWKNDLAPAEKYWTTQRDGAVKLHIGDTKYDNLPPMTVPQFFQRAVEKASGYTALAVKRDGEWKKWTYKEYFEDCKIAAKGFIKLGLESFNAVGIIGFNSPEWLISDLGAIFARGLAVGIYTTNSPEACKYVAEDSRANIVVVENQVQLSKFLKVWDQLPDLKAIIQYSGELEDKSNPNVYTWKDFMEIGKSCDDEELNKRLSALKPNECCTLVYTSGTTGKSKGVMLSHDNCVFTGITGMRFIQGRFGNEHSVSYLPLSHIAAQMMDIYMIMSSGGTLWFAKPDALKGSLGETLKEVRPTVFFGVPRVWEKMMEKMVQVGRNTTGMKRRIAVWAKGVGLKGNMNIEKGLSVPFGWKIADALIFKKIKLALGFDRCRHFATGAAPITMETLRYFQSINLPLFELYGMSESAGPVTIGKRGKNLAGSCGTTMDGLKLKIDKPDADENGEICIFGRNVFMGYLDNEEKIKEAIDEDGYLHSGDIGKIDKDGFLFITGRIKEIIITAGGENIAPVPIEDQVKVELPIVSNVMLIGDKRKFLSCLLTLKVVVNPDTGEPTDELTDVALDFCKKHGSEVKTVFEFLKRKEEKLMKAIQDGIDRYNEKAISRAQKIQKWCILERDFSIPGGELGPTMKMRRPIINKMYAEKIDAFYE